MSLDGFIDDRSSERLLLSNEADFDRVDAERSACDAVLLGAGAIRADNPRVVIRSPERRAERMAAGHNEHPLKVTLTRTGRLSSDLQWFHTGDAKVIYTTDQGAEVLRSNVDGLAEIVSMGADVDIESMLADLHSRGVHRLMVEGGEQIHTAFLASDVVDEVHLALAPLLVGDGPRFVAGGQFPWPTATRWTLQSSTALGDVVVLHYLLDHTQRDHYWLQQAIKYAEQCPPSPTAFAVGACIVSASGQELASGYSRETDEHVHAEESALAKLTEATDLSSATIYSSLEPCAQRASRPTPCAQLIIASGIKRVVMAWSEPTDFVDSPQGIAVLEEAGVEVVRLPVDQEPNYR